MIKANELRIGITCYFTEPNDDDIIDSYISTIEKHDLLSHLETGIPIFNPIPLTEEILLKCKIHKWFKSNTFECRLNLDNTVTIYAWEGGVSIFISHCKYIHQLQNIYFALTGEELIVEL